MSVTSARKYYTKIIEVLVELAVIVLVARECIVGVVFLFKEENLVSDLRLNYSTG